MLAEARDEGWALPDSVVVDHAEAAQVRAEIGADAADWMAVHRALPDGSSQLLVDPAHRDWGDPVATAQTHRLIGEWSTAERDHVLRHEVTHAAHRQGNPDGYAAAGRDLTAEEQAIAARVSRRARRSGREFVAEVGARLLGGYNVDAEALAMYRRLGGPAVRERS